MYRIILIIIICLLTSVASPADRTAYQPTIRLVAVGDMMLGRGVAHKIIKNGPDWLLENVKPVFKDADIIFGNLESPLTSNKSLPRKGFGFTGDPEMPRWLKMYGFNVLSVANNHAFDRGVDAIKDTLDSLSKYGIAAPGGGIHPYEPYQPKIVNIHETKFAFFAAENIVQFDSTSGKYGVAYIDLKKLIPEIKKVRDEVDYIIVSLHWGVEYAKRPSNEQIHIAHNLIDNGVDIVLGHHSHVIQGMERYKDGLIIYSLGNFAFDQKDERTKRSIVVAIDFYPMNRWFANPMVTPIAIREYRPVLDFSPTGDKTITELKEYGKEFGKDGLIEFCNIAPKEFKSTLPLPSDILNK